MTRDIILHVLALAERQTPNSEMHELDLSNANGKPEDLDEALRYCLERHYIELWNIGWCDQWMVKRLTADGHDKLRALRGQKPL